MSAFYERIERRIYHTLRKRIDRKIIVIESDDWGMERAINQGSVDYIIRKFGEDKISRWTTDSLETVEDLCKLYDLLYSFKTKFDKPPQITANFITHNVLAKSHQEVAYLPIDKGFVSQDIELLKPLYKQGIEQNLIFPQLHGYVHYHKDDLEQYLKSKRSENYIEIGSPLIEITIKGNLSLLSGEMLLRNQAIEILLNEASAVFQRMFGYTSTSFIAPHYLMDTELIPIIKKIGIKYLQGASRYSNGKNKKLKYPALRKRNGVTWGLRNARLDVHPHYSFLHDQCLRSIETAFKNNQPAIIDMHRVNFSGRFTPHFRDKALQELNLLFREIAKRWPDTIFLTSNQLNNYIYGT